MITNDGQHGVITRWRRARADKSVVMAHPGAIVRHVFDEYGCAETFIELFDRINPTHKSTTHRKDH